jgi:hypothetical protein
VIFVSPTGLSTSTPRSVARRTAEPDLRLADEVRIVADRDHLGSPLAHLVDGAAHARKRASCRRDHDCGAPGLQRSDRPMQQVGGRERLELRP